MRGVDAVLHLAGMMGVGARSMTTAVNVSGTENVCHVALAGGVARVVHVKLVDRVWDGPGQDAEETFLMHPFDEPYAVTKAAADMAVQRMIVDHHLPAVIIRPGTFFGPGDRLHFGRMADGLRGQGDHRRRGRQCPAIRVRDRRGSGTGCLRSTRTSPLARRTTSQTTCR